MAQTDRSRGDDRPLLLIDCYVDPKGAVAHFHPWMPGPYHHVHAPYDALPPSVDGFRGVIVTGSAASATIREPWIDAGQALLEQALGAGVPILGICFGHQLLGRTLGGFDTVARADRPEVGYVEIGLRRGDPLLDVLPERFETFVSHEDEVRVSSAFEVLGRSDQCPVQAIAARDHQAWGVQFHLEYPEHEQLRILRYREARHPEEGLDADAVFARRVDTTVLARALFDRFGALCR